MLELRPVCEHCAKALPPDSAEAVICSFECTFCRACADGLLANVCPNCGGGFMARPVRPQKDWKNGNNLTHHPASGKILHRPVDLAAHQVFAAALKDVPPQRR